MDTQYLNHLTSMDSLTLESLMSAYGQEVWNFAFSITKNRHMADDITQDVFIQVYRHVASFRGEASVKTWLFRITRNISYNYRNTAFFRKVLLMNTEHTRDYQHSAEQSFLEQEASNQVWRYVFDLPTKLREVLVLHAKYQLTLQEIAHVLQIPEGTVKSRLFTARKRMSKLLKEDQIYELI
ncbi:RNA polymerase sigma factor [Paenibacillus sp. strain BS8-2]